VASGQLITPSSPTVGSSKSENRRIVKSPMPFMTEATGVLSRQLLIGGEWRPATGGATIEVVNPATEDVVAVVASATAEDVDAAVTAARAALVPWGRLSARERGRLVYKLSQRLMERADEVARLETLHNGKPIFESRQIDIPASAECFEYYAGWADKVHGETVPVKGDYLTYTLREPVGVVGAIVPWNFPLLLASWKVAPALACGNTVVLKPATQTPLTALALGEIATEVGFPPGVLNVVTGPGSKVGQALVEHPRVAKIAFTGDTATGRAIMRGAADTVKTITLELGGKSPNIVFADADLDAAVRGATNGIFYGKGEVCAAGSRLLVDRAIKDEFMEKLAMRARKMQPGDPLDPKTRLGAISSKAQFERVLGYIDAGRKDGATLVAGGERADIGTGRGYFLQPTVFDRVTPSMRIAREEIFGPVLATLEFADVDEAIALANDSEYGLASAVWTRDIKKAHYVASRLQAGTVWVNTYNVYDAAASFGGYKQSGFGRELGAHALEHYTQLKTVWVDLNR
jgi:acyl-CoA reductase-like NAD-dependent aldehyde dehydrogenase